MSASRSSCSLLLFLTLVPLVFSLEEAFVVPPNCQKKCSKLCTPTGPEEKFLLPPRCQERCQIKCTKGELNEHEDFVSINEQQIALPPDCTHSCRLKCLPVQTEITAGGSFVAPPFCHRTCQFKCPHDNTTTAEAANAITESRNGFDLVLPPNCHRNCRVRCRTDAAVETEDFLIPRCGHHCAVTCSADQHGPGPVIADPTASVTAECRKNCDKKCLPTPNQPFLTHECREKCLKRCAENGTTIEVRDMLLPPHCVHHCAFTCIPTHPSAHGGEFVPPKCHRQCRFKCPEGHGDVEAAVENLHNANDNDASSTTLPPTPPHCTHSCNYRCALEEDQKGVLAPKCTKHCNVQCNAFEPTKTEHKKDKAPFHNSAIEQQWPPYATFPAALPTDLRLKLSEEDQKLFTELSHAFGQNKADTTCNIEKHFLCFSTCLNKHCLFGKCSASTGGKGGCECKLCSSWQDPPQN